MSLDGEEPQRLSSKKLSNLLTEKAGLPGQTCLVFPNEVSALECVRFATSTMRGDQQMSPNEFTIRTFDIQQRLWAVFFALDKMPNLVGFWMDPGVGISTRVAEDALERIDNSTEISGAVATRSKTLSGDKTPVYEQLRRRILQYLYRAPIDPSREQAASSDVYLYQTGMGAIYSLHKYLLNEYNQQSVLFSFPFHSTYHIFEKFGLGFQFYGLADENELRNLSSWLETYYAAGNKIQALWCEFPSNPLATTPDLKTLRQLADQYGFFLVVDDTVGSFCNVDLSSVADVLLTSLTKSFSGYADVMGGSIVLNPSLPSYPKLKPLFDKYYQNTLYCADAEVLLSNSVDYLTRSTIHHRNADALTSYFSSIIEDPSSCIRKVYYPSVNPSRPLYEAFMRPETDDFTPGYGCLMSVEFQAIEQAAAFFDALDLFGTPHLGAHVTLVLPYVKALFAKELEWAGKYDLRETQIRIAPGLEDTEHLLTTVKIAMEAAERVGRTSLQNGLKMQDEVATIS